MLGIGKSATKLRKLIVRRRRPNDCKARHASAIYSLAPRETVPELVVYWSTSERSDPIDKDLWELYYFEEMLSSAWYQR
jgi:hypothetical protein